MTLNCKALNSAITIARTTPMALAYPNSFGGLKCNLIQQVHYRTGAVIRAAGGQKLDQRETLEAVDGGNYRHIQCRRHDRRPLDVPEHLEIIGSIHLCGFLHGGVHIAQRCYVKNNRLTDGGRKQDQNNTPQGHGLTGSPGEAAARQSS